jgi:hypothetical protein
VCFFFEDKRLNQVETLQQLKKCSFINLSIKFIKAKQISLEAYRIKKIVEIAVTFFASYILNNSL